MQWLCPSRSTSTIKNQEVSYIQVSKQNFVYLIACQGDYYPYIKIGKTVNLYNRLSNIQTGCPHKISHAFIISSSYEEEVLGLERLLHRLLPLNIRGEWYKGVDDFFKALELAFYKINTGNFSFEELDELPDLNAGPELEIMLHHHGFQFKQVTLPIKRTSDINESSKNIEASDIIELLRYFGC
jgi:hypothetical protein